MRVRPAWAAALLSRVSPMMGHFCFLRGKKRPGDIHVLAVRIGRSRRFGGDFGLGEYALNAGFCRAADDDSGILVRGRVRVVVPVVAGGERVWLVWQLWLVSGGSCVGLRFLGAIVRRG